jgi:hypothetical protein
LAIDPKTPSTLYASAYPGAGLSIHKSIDSGVTWSPTGSLPNAHVVAVDPLNPAILYASIETRPDPPQPGQPGPPPGPPTGHLSRSSDAGATWTTITNGLPSGWFAGGIVTDPKTPGRVFALGSYVTGGVYRSDNGGNNWIATGAGLPDWQVNALAIDPANSSALYAASAAGGLYRSTDAGTTWKLMPGLRMPVVNSIAIDPSDPSRVYAATLVNPQDAFVMKIVP